MPTESIEPASTTRSGASDELAFTSSQDPDVEMEGTTQVGLGGDHSGISGMPHSYEYCLPS